MNNRVLWDGSTPNWFMRAFASAKNKKILDFSLYSSGWGSKFPVEIIKEAEITYGELEKMDPYRDILFIIILEATHNPSEPLIAAMAEDDQPKKRDEFYNLYWEKVYGD